ncbi:30S ribosomal protein S27e [Caldiplasma sukawensis]
MVKEGKKLKSIGNRFVKIKCNECENEQITYSKGSSVVNCNICGSVIAEPTGGSIKIKGELLEKY